MKPSHGKTIFAMNLAMLATFRLIGFGWHGDGILLESSSQSQKLISVWSKIGPIPLVVSAPVPIIAGIMIFGEPLHLIALELVFWACIAVADGLAISLIIGKSASKRLDM